MASVEELNNLLSAGAKILDTAACQVREVPLEPKRENIRKLAEALSLVFDVQRQIYKIQPDLEPEFLKQKFSHPEEGNKFGDIIIRACELIDSGDFDRAISLYENYISEGPPDTFADMAGVQIDRIKKEHHA